MHQEAILKASMVKTLPPLTYHMPTKNASTCRIGVQAVFFFTPKQSSCKIAVSACHTIPSFASTTNSKKRKGKGRKGRQREGKGRKGKKRKGKDKERKGTGGNGKERNGKESKGAER